MEKLGTRNHRGPQREVTFRKSPCNFTYLCSVLPTSEQLLATPKQRGRRQHIYRCLTPRLRPCYAPLLFSFPLSNRATATADATAKSTAPAIAEALGAAAGLAFAEWGPGDMGMSYGYADAHDPPYPPELETARKTVKAAGDKTGLAFLRSWHDPNKTEQENVQFLFDWGVKVISCRTEETKAVGLGLRPR